MPSAQTYSASSLEVLCGTVPVWKLVGDMVWGTVEGEAEGEAANMANFQIKYMHKEPCEGGTYPGGYVLKALSTCPSMHINISAKSLHRRTLSIMNATSTGCVAASSAYPSPKLVILLNIHYNKQPAVNVVDAIEVESTTRTAYYCVHSSVKS